MDFNDIVGTIEYPMVIVTGAADGDRAGCLAGFTTQCSIDPPRWIVCISKANHTHHVATRASTLAVHVLRETQGDLAELFGSATGDDVDKFEWCEWRVGPDDVPVLADTDWFAGRSIDTWDVGDHTAVLLEVRGEGSALRSSEPQLGFQQVRDLEAGHDRS